MWETSTTGVAPLRRDFRSEGTSYRQTTFLRMCQKSRIVKIHGSVNWLFYCDNCRRLYWFPAKDGATVAMQLITRREGRRLKLPGLDTCARWHCMHCKDVALTTRVATFSYLKALDFPMFERSWSAAERVLRQAEKWIFIGYSLPAADYEIQTSSEAGTALPARAAQICRNYGGAG